MIRDIKSFLKCLLNEIEFFVFFNAITFRIIKMTFRIKTRELSWTTSLFMALDEEETRLQEEKKVLLSKQRLKEKDSTKKNDSN